MIMLLMVTALAVWIAWGKDPDPKISEIPFHPDAIIVLGGGDGSRGREAYRMHMAYPQAAMIVTGDGNEIFDSLVKRGMAPERIHHETHATSTWENATLTLPILNQLHASKAVIVTDWFHMPRALAVFRKVHKGRRFHPSFEPKSGDPSECEVSHARRERGAMIYYTLRHGIQPLSDGS